MMKKQNASPENTTRRRFVSLSPAKNRPPQKPRSSSNGKGEMNVTTNTNMNNNSDRKKKSSHASSSSNNVSRYIHHNHIAVSQEESCLVSATGDVLVCRGREFAQLFGLNEGGGKPVVDNAAAVMQWCEMECADFANPMTSLEQSALCNPWMPARNAANTTSSSSNTNHHHADHHFLGAPIPGTGLSLGTGSQTAAAAAVAMLSPGLKGGATNYEWGARESHFQCNKREGLTGNVSHMPLVTDRATTVDNTEQHNSPFSSTAEDDFPDIDDQVLSLPSFDYSHFGNGGNDMVPTSPSRGAKNRLSPIFDEEHEHLDNGINNSNNNTNHRYPSQITMQHQQYHHPVPTKSTLLPNGHASVLKINLPQAQNMIPIHRAGMMNRPPNHCVSFPQPIIDKKSSQQTNEDPADVLSRPQFMHGVPTFLPALSQVRITQVSAHPLGSHVLLISAEALLFSYGLNDHGQLGIGMKTPVADHHRRFIWRPTIITPLLENGGKAITCAAGESHSLVVVMTEGRRILKSQLRGNNSSQQMMNDHYTNGGATEQVVTFDLNRVISSPSAIYTDKPDADGDNSSSSRSPSASESVLHHQLYGFGRNNFTKIGLVHPKRSEHNDNSRVDPSITATEAEDEMDDVLLPRRVALHCTVWPEKLSPDSTTKTSPLPPRGIFAVSASSEHSAALVRRATGDIELYTWGNAAYGALALPFPVVSSTVNNVNQYGGSASSKIVPVPTLVGSLSYSPKPGSEQASKFINKTEYPVGISLGPYSSFLVTSEGRCLSFGISLDGMLGQGRGIREAPEPGEVKFPTRTKSGKAKNISITSISAGTGHVVALTNTGDVYTWGSNQDARLGQQQSTSTVEDGIQWLPKKVDLSSHASSTTVDKKYSINVKTNRKAPPLQPNNKDNEHIVQICAGCDCTFFVAKSGKVFSCGKMSGRLGLGELNTDVDIPKPLFGGLRLWNSFPTHNNRSTTVAATSPTNNKKIHYDDLIKNINSKSNLEEEDPLSTSTSASANANSPKRPFLKRGVTLA